MTLIGTMAGMPVYAQNYERRVIDLRSPLSQDIMELLVKQCPKFQIQDYQKIAIDVQIAAKAYELEPGFILAIMAAEEDYPRFPQARLYYFNLDMGPIADPAIFPVPWFDAERIARAYRAQFERYDDREKAIAAYFVGHQQLAPNFEVSKLPQNLKNIISKVLKLSAEWAHLGERKGPQIVTTDEKTPENSFQQPEWDLSEIEKSYIQNMMYFNPKLKPSTAREIFQSILKNAQDFPEVDARLVMALVACESSFRPEAVSRAGALGLGQLMPFTAKHFGVSDPFDINENIRATFAYLRRELKRWSKHNYQLDRVLAAYNAGPSAVEKYTDPPYHGIPPYNETRNYVRKVINIYFYLLPEDERWDRLHGKSRHITEAHASVHLAS